MNKALAGVAVCALAAAVVFGTAYSLTRPTPPNLSNINEWTLVKAAYVNLPPRGLDLKVYLYKRDSTESDPYDVRQNKIVVQEGDSRVEFMWPSEYDFAGAWVEVFQRSERSIAIVLFDGEYAARVVSYEAGAFRYRVREDELISPRPLRYERSRGVETPRFIDPSTGASWRWNAAAGFERDGLIR